MKVFLRATVAPDGDLHSVCGIYTTEDLAWENAELGDLIGPIELDTTAPKEDTPWEGAYIVNAVNLKERFLAQLVTKDN